MTPKEKAKELVDRFKRYVDFTDENGNTSLKAIVDNSKQCALIAVDEILNSITRKKYLVEIGQWIETPENNYWLQVKQEINNL